MENSGDIKNKNDFPEKIIVNEEKFEENEINNQNKIEFKKDEGLFSDNNPIPMNIANQVLKSICKIIIKRINGNIYGTGFFMKLGKSNNNKYLITNYHIISPETIKEDIEIEIYNQKKMKLVYNNRYVKYYPKPKDITIIEIKNNDKIYGEIQLLEYDLNYRLGYKIYKNVNVFSIEHPLGEDAACASGKIKDINNFEFDHNIPTDDGSSGCPIILLNNNINIIQVIGIHKLADYSRKVNCGTFIGEILKKDSEGKLDDNCIIAELDIDEIDIHNAIRILNSYDDVHRRSESKIIFEERKNEEEIKKCEIKINNKIFPFSYFFKFKNEGRYSIKYSFKNCLNSTSYMFSECRNLIKIDLSHFNAEKVITMDNMFSYCNSLKKIDFFKNTQNVKNMDNMFFSCNSLKNVDLSSLNLQNIISAKAMFYGCKSLTYVNLSSLNTQNSKNLMLIFNGCPSLDKKNIIIGNRGNQK